MKKIILASASPRRRELLEKFDIDFEIKTSKIDERIGDNEDPRIVSMALAFEKANAIKGEEDNLIISADTIVVLDDKILGKPRSREEARAMILSLSGRSHQVITGMALIEGKKKVIAYDETRVKFKNIADEQLERYLDYNEYMDKAGAYGIQGRAAVFVEKIEGSYFNVMGLPIDKLDILLGENFDMTLL